MAYIFHIKVSFSRLALLNVKTVWNSMILFKLHLLIRWLYEAKFKNAFVF